MKVDKGIEYPYMVKAVSLLKKKISNTKKQSRAHLSFCLWFDKIHVVGMMLYAKQLYSLLQLHEHYAYTR